jgi:alpha-1,6-mannosyltransferase
MALPLGTAPYRFISAWSCAYDIVIFGISLILRSSGLSIPQAIRRKRLRNAIGLLTAVSTIVRLEIALFLLPVVLSLVVQGRLSLKDAVLYGMTSGLGALGKTY